MRTRRLASSLTGRTARRAVRVFTPLGLAALAIALAACGGSSKDAAVTRVPTRLAFQVQPLDVTAGAPQTAAVAVGVLDQTGQPLSASLDVTISLETAPVDAALLGTTTVRAVGGVAAFPSLAFPRAGSYTLRASAAGLGGATSASFAVSPAAAHALAFTDQPATATVRADLSPPPGVMVRDAYGNDVATAVGVTLAAQGGPGSLSGTTARSTTGGFAAFAGVSLAEEGEYRLAATADGLEPALSGTFTVADTVPPAAPSSFAADATSPYAIHVTWTATGDDGDLGTATAYDLRIGTADLVSDADFAAATPVPTGAPAAAGMAESADVTSLSPGTTYYVALRIFDSAGNSVRTGTIQTATLACPAGYTGATCSECAADYLLDGGECRRIRAALRSDVLVTEYLARGGYGGPEWFEVQNLATAYPIALGFAPVRVPETDRSFDIRGDLVVRSGERVVFASAEMPGVAVAQVWPPAFYLAFGGTLRIGSASDPLDEALLWMPYSDSTTARQLSSAVTAEGATLWPGYWCDATTPLPDGSGSGTPGGANGDCGLSPAPPPPADWCQTVFPASFDAAAAGTPIPVFGQVYAPGFTDVSSGSPYPLLVMELGHGSGRDPAGWTWTRALFNGGYSGTTNDEYVVELSIPAAGSYRYGYRAALRSPFTGELSAWRYCDLDGSALPDPAAGNWGIATITAP